MRLSRDHIYSSVYIVALLTILIGIAAFIFYCFPVYPIKNIDATSVTHIQGYSYVVPAPEFLPDNVIIKSIFSNKSDSNESPTASSVQLIEDGVLFGIPHSAHAEIIESGFGRFSHWSGAIIFSTSDNSNPIDNSRVYTVRQAISPKWWIPMLLIILGGVVLHFLHLISTRLQVESNDELEELLKFRKIISHVTKPSNHRFLYWGLIATLWIYLNLIFFQLLPTAVPAVDSHLYFIWSLIRTIGYPAFLNLYHVLFSSWEYFHLFQLNLILAGLFALSYAIVRVSGSYIIGWLFLALILNSGNMLLSAADLLTEGVFSGFIMLHLAFVYLLLNKGGILTSLVAGLALAAAILIKSVAVVFLGPVFLFLIFAKNSRRGFFILLIPALFAWLVPSTYNYVHNGFFESSIAGGFALSGHVGWGIRPYPGSAYPEEARLIEHRLKPILEKRPTEFNSIDEYINFTTNEYNPLLWGNIIPELALYHSDKCSINKRSCTWMKCDSQCDLQLAKISLQLAKDAIANDPWAYTKHVVAHYYGMWRFVFSYKENFLIGTNRRAESLPTAYSMASNLYQELLAPVPPFKNPSERTIIVSRINNSFGKRMIDLLSLSELFDDYLTDAVNRFAMLVLIVSLVGSVMVFKLRNKSHLAASFCYTALIANAYFLGHALAQPVLVRYAWPMQGVVAALIFLGLVLIIKGLIDIIKVVKGFVSQRRIIYL